MAVTWIMLDFGSASLTTGTISWGGVGSSSSHAAITKTTTKTVTVPSGLTYTGAWLYQTLTCSSVIHHTTVSGNAESKVTWTNYDSGYKSNTPYYAISTPAAGTTVTVTYRLYVGSASYDTSKSFADYSFTSSHHAWLCLQVNLPTISSVLTASEVNTLATILNATTVTQGSAITRAGPQSIGTNIGSKVFTTWNKKDASNNSTAVAAVTFDSTKPLSSNINSVITKLTDSYVFR